MTVLIVMKRLQPRLLSATSEALFWGTYSVSIVAKIPYLVMMPTPIKKLDTI